MTQKKSHNNKDNKVKDKKDNYNKNIEFDLVDEVCQRCHKRMFNAKYIWVGINDDRYYCTYCKNKFGLNAVLCDGI